MASRTGRSSSPLTDLFQNLNDDVKDFVDDDLITRTSSSERDVRRAGRRWSDDNETAGGRRRSAGGGEFTEELEDLRDAIRLLQRKVTAIQHQKTQSGEASADAPIAGYSDLTVEEILPRLTALSQDDLTSIQSYERSHAARTTILDRVEALRGTPPWPEYDVQTVTEIRKFLAHADDETLREVRNYERRHKNRQGILDATDSAVNS